MGEIRLPQSVRENRSTLVIGTLRDMHASTFSAVREGDLLAGKYRIERVLGVGGMGVIVAAQHLQLDEKVAIKCLLPTALEHPEAVERFLREAKAAVRIKSEHVARVSDVGTLDNGAPFMVMEYLDGCDLAQWLRQSGPLSTEQAVEFVLQALEAIAEAHGLGIVHRDLKPGNLFCVRRSDGVLSIKVLDFGISKVTLGTPTAPQFDMTAPATIMGSPLYMSPEQMRSARDVDVRTDIWSIGVILYELLTGNPPFNGETISEVCVKTAASPPSPMRLSRPEIPVELEIVILKCLEKDRQDRYPNVAELAAALSAFAPRRARPSVERISRIIAEAGLGSFVFESPPNSERSLQPTAARTDANFLPAPTLRRLPSWGAMTGLFVLGILFVGLGLWWFRLRSSAPTAAEVAPSETVVPSVPGRAIPSSTSRLNVLEPNLTKSAAALASVLTEAAQRSPKFEVGKPQRKTQPKAIQGKKDPAIDPFGSPH